MTIRKPIILNGKTHDVLQDGEAIPGSAIPLSTDTGNQLGLGTDGGLFAPAATPGHYAMTATNTDLLDTDWAAAGSPSSWSIGRLEVAIPDGLNSMAFLAFLSVSVSPVTASALSYYDSNTPTGAQSRALFMQTGSPAGRLTVKPDSNVPVPSWGVYLVNPDRAVLNPGSTFGFNRTLNGVSYTGHGVIRVYERLTLVPLG